MNAISVDGLRYLVAAVILVTVGPAFAGWLLVHGFIDAWRRIGPRVAYPVVFVAVVAMAAGIYAVRAPLLEVEFGGNAWRVGLAIVLYALAVRVEVACWSSLTLRTLVGLPELAPDSEPQNLLQDGIYGVVRHPRYLGFILGLAAVALVVDYLAVYLFVPVFVLQTYWVTMLEERELADRFDDYSAYQRRVPRLFPRITS